MSTETILFIAQIIVSVILIIVILLQQRGSGLGGAFGGSGGSEGIYYTKRGAEKFLFYATIVLAIIFVGLGIANLII